MTDSILPLRALPERPNATLILRRVAVPFFVFSFVLTLLLLLSWTLLLPRVTKVNMEGTMQSLSQLRSYRASLLSGIQKEEQNRMEAVLPFSNARYEELKEQKSFADIFLSLRERIFQTSISLVPELDAVHIASFSFLSESRELRVEGEVRNVGPRSMTVLAQFVDELSRIPAVGSVSQPKYIREEDERGFRSPFSILLSLQ